MDLREKRLTEYNLSDEEFEEIIGLCLDKVEGNNDLDWQDIVDKYNLPINRDTLRKNMTGLFGSASVFNYYQNKNIKEIDNDEYLDKLDEKKRELERARIQYRDSRNAWQKQNYKDARINDTLDILEEKISNLGVIYYSPTTHEKKVSDRELVVTLADLHIGQTFDNLFGKYNSTIAEQRLNKYLDKIIEIIELYDIGKVHVVGLGDNVSGSIHKNIQVTNRENAIEQIKICSELITGFCYELTKLCDVMFYNVAGNHSRLEKKEDADHYERTDDLIGWIVCNSLKHIENFHDMNHRRYDIGIVDVIVCSKYSIIGVHGDFDNMNKTGISNLCMFLQFSPYMIVKGHMHSPAYMEYNNVKCVQAGSMAGTGDQYTLEKRLTGKPSQTAMLFNQDGLECIYNIEL